MPLQLTASPQTISQIFGNEYYIPSFQRPYSWDATQCRKLVDDLVGFHQSGDADPYFLGGIVVAKERDEQGQDKPLVVIDGQQRLTTLSLFIKVIFDRAQTYDGLREYLQKKNKTTGEILNELRVVSDVMDEDRRHLEAALLGKGELAPQSIFAKNMRCLAEALDDSEKALEVGGGFRKFVETLQKRVIMLPIECTSTANATSSALQIFRTLNDRGLHLDDADLFKADMYAKLPVGDRDWFKNNWNALTLREDANDDFVERLFRIHMHVLLAHGEKAATKEPKLRSYFVEDNPKTFDDPRSVIGRLQKYRAIFDNWRAMAPIIDIWWEVLNCLPNMWWQYPLFVFLDKHGDWDVNTGVFSLSENKEAELTALMLETARYFYIKGVATNSVDRIKDTVFRVCRAIASGQNYIDLYRDNAKGSNVDDFRAKLKRSEYGRHLKGLVLANSALHPSQKDDDSRRAYANLLTRERGVNYEHILPRRWNHYPEWNTEEAHAEDLEKLGNIIPFEGHLNKKAGNESFALKKEAYAESALAEVVELGKLSEWTPKELAERHEQVMERLLDFFQY